MTEERSRTLKGDKSKGVKGEEAIKCCESERRAVGEGAR